MTDQPSAEALLLAGRIKLSRHNVALALDAFAAAAVQRERERCARIVASCVDHPVERIRSVAEP